MSDLHKAAQAALDALELPCDRWNATQYNLVTKAASDLRTALAQEPSCEYKQGFADGQKEFAKIAGGQWQEAVIEQLIIHHIYRAKHDSDPQKAINDLLCYSNQIALDPLVSSDAQALIDHGRALAQESAQQTKQKQLFEKIETLPAVPFDLAFARAIEGTVQGEKL